MRRIGNILFIWLYTLTLAYSQSFIEEQLRFPRVDDARDAYHEDLKELFQSKGMNFPPSDLYFRVFKFDKELELWARDEGEYVHIKTYTICQLSGELGPKRKRGDLQIPEGFYELARLNPSSAYHLSIKVNYPNEADRLLGFKDDLGGDIYIHGDCVTVGCIPIEDEPIKELYWLSVLAKDLGGNIPIHIFPFRMDEVSVKFFKRIPLFESADWYFWNQLIPVYNYFEHTRQVPKISVLSNGDYKLSNDKNFVNY